MLWLPEEPDCLLLVFYAVSYTFVCDHGGREAQPVESAIGSIKELLYITRRTLDLVTHNLRDMQEYNITTRLYSGQTEAWLGRFCELRDRLLAEGRLDKQAELYMSYLAEFYVYCESSCRFCA